MATIHPTAIVDASARLGAGVIIGPHAVVEPDTVIGDGCEIRAGAVIRRYTEMGPGNVVHSCAVLGGEPQDYKFDPNSRTFLRIGANNVFREHVTLSRATTAGGATVIGSGGYFMACSHVGHDSVIGDGVVLVNGAGVGGHAELHDRAILSAYVMIHQFCWVGQMVMSRGHSGASQHVPPFVMLGGINQVIGLNSVGLRRAAHITEADRCQVKQAYRLLYRSGLTNRQALAEMDKQADWGPAATSFREFVRRVLTASKPYNRGLISPPAAVRGEEKNDE